MTGPSARQLILSLERPPQFSAEDYLVTPANEGAYSLLTAWPNWPIRAVLLSGPEGSGKSHLATIWSSLSDAVVIDAERLDLDAVSDMPLESALVVDHADRAADTDLFHLLNTAREHRLWLLLTASRGPGADWPQLPDLASRMRALPQARLDAPGDELVRAVLVKLFDDRQLAVEAGVVDYIARRMERSLAAARDVVAALDEEALTRGKAVTRTIAADVLARATYG
ncbi:hypothetical protein [Terrihabitans sp. B22-R8]|uniref:hypothetical protein n=1 Tax=Terrihabitans sp. B22-R8 TaxID=3425128 RepID=UPI00403CBAD2